MIDPLSHLPGYALRRAANSMMEELARRLAPLSLRITEASVLLLVGGAQHLTSSEIGRILDIQRANMVPLLARLEALGLISRLPLDKKSQAIVLTTQGLAALADVQRITDIFEADLLARVPAKHRAHLVPALNALWD